MDYILSSVLSFKISHSRVVTADATAETILNMNLPMPNGRKNDRENRA